MLTAQEVFTKVKNHLLSQNKKAVDPLTGFLRYKTPTGLKCALGCLIEDNFYSSIYEGISVNPKGAIFFSSGGNKLHESLEASGIDVDGNLLLLDRLQGVHDCADVAEWPDKLSAVAKSFGLKYEG